MDSESTPIVKLIAGAVGLVVVCFCVGFFLLGGRSNGSNAAPVAEAAPDATPSPLALDGGESPRLSVVETTERKPTAPGNLRVTDASPAGEASPAPKASPKVKPSPEPSDTSEGAANVGAGKTAAVKPKAGSGNGETVQIPAPQDDTKEATPKPDAADPDEPSTSGESGSLYRVRVKNSFGSHDDADQLASELKGRGFSASVMPAGKGKFQVQIGAYKDKKRAEEKQKELEKNNYDTHISDKSGESDGEKSSEGAKKEEGEKKSGDG